MNYSRVILVGNLTRDPELKQFDGGCVAKFGLAVNNKRGGKEEVLFIDVEAWNKTGELVAQYLKKGGQALVDGRLKMETWEGQDGQKRSKILVSADNVQFGAKAKGDGEGRNRPDTSFPPDGDDIP